MIGSETTAVLLQSTSSTILSVTTVTIHEFETFVDRSSIGPFIYSSIDLLTQ